MSDSDQLIFADEDELVFAGQEDGEGLISHADKWKVLIVDDEPEVHRITTLVLRKFDFEGKGLEFISAYSQAEAMQLIEEHPDTALVLLDIVMDEDDAGLKVAKYIRETAKNRLVRIVLRTGQPGQAPEERVILDYDINGYKEKTELTTQKLFSEVVSALRNYRDLYVIEQGRKSLQSIIDASSNLLNLSSVRDFYNAMLKQLVTLIYDRTGGEELPECFYTTVVKDQWQVAAAYGSFQRYVNCGLQEVLGDTHFGFMKNAYENKMNFYRAKDFFLYIPGKRDRSGMIYCTGSRILTEDDRGLIEVFLSNAIAIKEAIESHNSYELERKQRLLSETLRETNLKLTSTFDMKEIIEHLLDGIATLIRYDSAVVLLNRDSTFDVYLQKLAKGQVSKTGMVDPGLYWVISRVVASNDIVKIDDTTNFNQPYESRNIRQEVKFGDSIRSVLGVPLLSNGKVLGVLVLENRVQNAFSNNDREMAMVFAAQTGIAIENAYLFNRINLRNADIRMLLDNAGQGFLTFGDNLLIDHEYSVECVKMFGDNISGKTFCQLFCNDLIERKFWEDAYLSVLTESDPLKKSVLLSLLPKEIVVNKQIISLEYKLLTENQNKIMVIMTDISEKRKLEDEVEMERRILKMVVKVVGNFNDFTSCIKEYEYFCDVRLQELLNEGIQLEDTVYEVFRNIHTFKGVFAQLGIINAVNRLHALETEINNFKKVIQNKSMNDFRTFMKSFELHKWLDEDIGILREALGTEYINKDRIIIVDEARLIEIEARLLDLLPYEKSNMIRRDIRRLRYKNFKDMLQPYTEYVKNLSENSAKPINAMEVTGNDVFIDADRYHSLVKSLTHMFRNCVDHGIEQIDDRIISNKPEIGNIGCSFTHDSKCIYLRVTDDGAGIDVEKVRRKAVEKGILNPQQLEAMTETDIVALIFKDDFSTKDDITELSGRGFGLAAVKHEVDKLGGKINVDTCMNKGTTFELVIPIIEEL